VLDKLDAQVGQQEADRKKRRNETPDVPEGGEQTSEAAMEVEGEEEFWVRCVGGARERLSQGSMKRMNKTFWYCSAQRRATPIMSFTVLQMKITFWQCMSKFRSCGTLLVPLTGHAERCLS
jgi:hypothetical protein